MNSVEPFCLLYLGDSIKFTPRYRSPSMTLSVENISDLQLIPS